MRHIVLVALSLYQKLISPLIEQILGTRNICRFSPTCSEYAKIAIRRDGVLKGGYLAAKRILKCQPYYNHKTI